MSVTLTTEQLVIVEDAVAFIRTAISPIDPEELAECKTLHDDELPPVPDCGVAHWSCAGLAGTGKTTILVEVVRRIRALGYRVAVGAFTGKAVGVVNSKQDVFIARTLHSLFTRRATSREADVLNAQLDELQKFEDTLASMPPEQRAIEAANLAALTAKLDAEREKIESDIRFQPKTFAECYYGVRYSRGEDEFGHKIYSRGPGFDLIVVDEASMVSTRLDAELMAHVGIPKLYFGDNHQLPPVEELDAHKECIVDLDKATHTLKTIHRQAAESGIIQVAHIIAKQRKYPAKEVASAFNDVLLTDDTSLEFAASHAQTHQILCFTNKVRKALGPMTREVCKLEPHPTEPWRPCVGEYLTIDANAADQGLMKGTVVEVLEVCPLVAGQSYPLGTIVNGFTNLKDEKKVAAYETRCFTTWVRCRKVGQTDELMVFVNCNELAECYDPSIRATPSKNKLLRSSFGIRVQFGRVGTVHKAQGSEWPNVLYYGDMPTNHPDWSRHAYTGVTRAQKSLVVCSKAFKKQRTVKEILEERRAAKRQSP